MLLPIQLLGEGEKFPVLCRFGFDGRRVLFQLEGQVGQPLQIRVHLLPVDFLKEGFDALLVGLLIPGAPGILRFLHQILILQEGCPLHPPLLQVLIQIRTDPALGGVDLQPGQDGQHFRFLLKTFTFLCIGVLVVGNDAAVQSGVADLPNPGGEGAPHHFEPGLPVIRAADQGLRRGDHQQRDVCLIGECVICAVPGRLIVPADALIQDRVGDGLDYIPVIVRTAQTLCRQHGGVHHDKVGEMAEVIVPHLQLFFPGIVEGELQFFVSGNVGIAQKGAGISVLIGRAGCVEGAGFEPEALGHLAICLVPFLLRERFQQIAQKIHQVAGEIAVVSGHDQPPHGIVLQNLLCPVIQLPLINGLANHARVLAQDLAQQMFPALAAGQDAPAVHPVQEVLPLERFVGPEVVVGQLGLFGEPAARILFRVVVPAVRKIPGAELLLPDGDRIQKLIVQLGVGFRLHSADIGDVQSMAVTAEGVPVVLPGHPTAFQPAKSLEHAFGEDDVHILDIVLPAPDVADHLLAAQF